MGYRSRTAEYPDYGVSIAFEEPVSQVWVDSDGFWIMTDRAPDMLEAEQMHEYLDDEPVTVETGEMISIQGEEQYRVPGDSRFGFLPRKARFSMHLTDSRTLSERAGTYQEGEGTFGLVNAPEPRLLNYDDVFNIADFVLEEVMGVDIDQDTEGDYLDLMSMPDRSVREIWDDLVSGRG